MSDTPASEPPPPSRAEPEPDPASAEVPWLSPGTPARAPLGLQPGEFWTAGVIAAILLLVAVVALVVARAPGGCNPTVGQVVGGVFATVAAALGASLCIYWSWLTRNWIAASPGIGFGLVVLGFVGQNATYATQSAGMQSACAALAPQHPGMWDASLSLLGIGVDPVQVVGLLIAAVGGCAWLLFEHHGPTREARLPHPAFEGDDTI